MQLTVIQICKIYAMGYYYYSKIRMSQVIIYDVEKMRDPGGDELDCYIFMLSDNVRYPLGRTKDPLNNSELAKAENFMVKAMKHQEFAADIQNLQIKGFVSPNSKLKEPQLHFG
ncbi:hypothetical protein HNY73_021249 [Argiope bruennichi]|uniref:Uncharacterized protein n=1 Tax=Argiope bruennichi TaxID=94029 RepID=A0A8T0EAL0_ARGBR|nr:hypothetical protein HNY73_021249 [Argiope bruennichi]